MRSRSRAGIRQPLTLPVTQAAAASRRNLIESGHPYTDSCTRKGGLPATTRDLPPCVGTRCCARRPSPPSAGRCWQRLELVIKSHAGPIRHTT